MGRNTVTLDGGEPRWLQTLVGFGLIVVFGVWLHGLLISVDYRWATVVDVGPVAGGDAFDRMVLVETPERYRVLRTSDHLLRVDKGAPICLARKKYLSKRWLRYSVVLPGYCRGKPRQGPSMQG